MAKKTGCPPFSDSISQFCSLMDSAKKDYAWNYEEMRKMDQLTQDYLHKLELEQLTYSERAKVATQLTKCRQMRRNCKDMTETLEPLVAFLESERGKNLCNLMREVLGKTRKVEQYMEHRVYIPRVLTEE